MIFLKRTFCFEEKGGGENKRNNHNRRERKKSFGKMTSKHIVAIVTFNERVLNTFYVHRNNGRLVFLFIVTK